jgi:tRNA(fMet)-specific endonuclease VapC
MKWMLDTDTCIALIKRQPRELIKRLQTKAVGDVGISCITLAELRHGVAKSARLEQNRAALDQFLLPLDIAAFDDLAADAYGSVRAALEAEGTPIGPLDTLIAGHAVSLNAVLVTHNVAEFKRVAGLRLDDWLR